jgi:hypothetical protein
MTDQSPFGEELPTSSHRTTGSYRLGWWRFLSTLFWLKLAILAFGYWRWQQASTSSCAACEQKFEAQQKMYQETQAMLESLTIENAALKQKSMAMDALSQSEETCRQRQESLQKELDQCQAKRHRKNLHHHGAIKSKKRF